MSNQRNTPVSVAIVGGTGYTGVELIRLLAQHPMVELKLITSRSKAGVKVAEHFGSLRGVCELAYGDLDIDALATCDVVFFATPHGVAMKHADRLLKSGVKVVDLAADFRLQNLNEFERWYKMPHSAPKLVPQAVYGLSEVNREAIANASLIGNPGCYPTTVLLGLEPLITARKSGSLIEPRIIIDAKSGVSGAGRKGEEGLIFSELSDNFKAYGVAGHRHSAEINQGLRARTDNTQFDVTFTPHLVPMVRGMFSTIYVTLSDVGRTCDIQALYETRYADELFVDVMPTGSLPETRSVRASNKLRIALHQHEQHLTILVVQDNLVKGAAGQAIQNMNIMCDFEESLGLMSLAVSP